MAKAVLAVTISASLLLGTINVIKAVPEHDIYAPDENEKISNVFWGVESEDGVLPLTFDETDAEGNPITYTEEYLGVAMSDGEMAWAEIGAQSDPETAWEGHAIKIYSSGETRRTMTKQLGSISGAKLILDLDVCRPYGNNYVTV